LTPGSRPQRHIVFHYGSLYALSTPLLLELTNKSFAYPFEHTVGPEDRLVGEWILHLPEETQARIRHVNNEGRFVDGPYTTFERQDWMRAPEVWGRPALNESMPACGAEGDLRKEALVVHQLKREEDFAQMVDWWIDGTPIVVVDG
jgi:hypothetical protein